MPDNHNPHAEQPCKGRHCATCAPTTAENGYVCTRQDVTE